MVGQSAILSLVFNESASENGYDPSYRVAISHMRLLSF